MSLTKCLKKIGSGIDKDTVAELKRVARSYREDDGMSANDASLAASKDMLNELLEERKQIADEVKSKGGVVPARSESTVKADLTEGKKETKFSRKWEVKKEDGLAVALAKTIGADIDNFVTGLSEKKSMKDIVEDVAKQVKVQEASPYPMPDQTPQSAQAAFLEKRRNRPDLPHEYWLTMTDEQGKEVLSDLGVPMTATVLEFKREGVIEMDISSFEKGNGGNVLYQVVANYALNNGLKFQGDRNGLSPMARIRRTEQMLASALKAGTTTHMVPHHWQYKGDTGTQNVEGVIRLDWQRDQDEHNIKEMVNSLIDTWHNLVPAINDYTYNFETERFEHSDGQQVQDTEFDRAADSARDQRLYKKGGGDFANIYTDEQSVPAGSGTLKRAVYFKAARDLQGQAAEFLPGQDDRLAKYVRGFKKNTKDGKISYSRKTEEEYREKFKDWDENGFPWDRKKPKSQKSKNSKTGSKVDNSPSPEKTEIIPNFSIITPGIVEGSSQDVQQVEDWLRFMGNNGIKKEEMEALGLTADELSALSEELYKTGVSAKPKQIRQADLLEYIEYQTQFLKFIEEANIGNNAEYGHMRMSDEYGKKEGYAEFVIDLPRLQSQKASGEPGFVKHLNTNTREYNNFAHTRATIRKDANGERFLMIEEIQSDAQQQAKKHGFYKNKKKSKLSPFDLFEKNKDMEKVDRLYAERQNIINELSEKDIDVVGNTVMSTEYISDNHDTRLHESLVHNDVISKDRALLAPDEIDLISRYSGLSEEMASDVTYTLRKSGIGDISVESDLDSKFVAVNGDGFIIRRGIRLYELYDANFLNSLPLDAVNKIEPLDERIPYMPMSKTWELFLFKKMLVFAKKNGIKKISWPATAEQVSKIEGWGSNHTKRYKAITGRYTEKLPRMVNKFAKKYNSKVEKETTAVDSMSEDERLSSERVVLAYENSIPVIKQVELTEQDVVSTLGEERDYLETISDYDKFLIGDKIYVVAFQPKENLEAIDTSGRPSLGMVERSLKSIFANSETVTPDSGKFYDIGYNIYDSMTNDKTQATAEGLLKLEIDNFKKQYENAKAKLTEKTAQPLNTLNVSPELEAHVDDMTMFSRAIPKDQVTHSNKKEKSAIRQRIERRIQLFRYVMQDKFIDLKDAQNIAGNVTEKSDVYGAESIWQSMAGEKIERFKENTEEDILNKIGETGLSLSEAEEWLHARHAEEANAYLEGINPNKTDNTALSGMSNDDARVILGKHKAQGYSNVLEEVGAIIDRTNNDRLDMMVDYGLIDQETVDTWRATYKHYIPLRRAETEELISPRGSGFNVRGKESQSRLGSNKDVVNIIAHTFSQYENTIVRGEKNRVGQAMYNFAKSNEASDWWEVDEIKKIGKVKDGEAKWYNDPTEADNELHVKVDGKTHNIRFDPNGTNEKAARIIKAMKNLEQNELSGFVKTLLGINRFLSSINTSWSPEFIISNFARDLQTAGYNLTDTDLSNMEMKVLKNVPGALRGLKRNLRNNEADSGWAEWSERFRLAGGKTGWIDNFKDIEERRDKIAKQLERVSKGKAPKSVFIGLVKAIEDYNAIAENGVRLAAFKVAIEEGGMSEKQAAVLAKNLTVNFNRKGMSGSTMNALYLFYNASIQGSTRMLQAMVTSKKGRMLAATTIGLAVGLDIMNRALSGDDDDGENIYDGIPDYVKNRNWIIMGEKEPIVKIPLPWGYNVLHIIGQQVGKGLTTNNFSALDATGAIFTGIIESFNPVGSGTFLQTIAPTVADPFVMIGENKNWAGQPLKPENLPFGTAKPEYQMHWRKHDTGAPKAIAKFLNDLSGGDEVRPGAINISPEWIEVLTEFSTGAAGRTVTNTYGTAKGLVTDEEIELDTVPFARKVTGFDSSRQLQSRYYERAADIQYTRKQLETLPKKERIEIKRSPKAKLVGYEKTIGQILRKLGKQKNVIRASKLSKEVKEQKIEKIDELIRKLQTNFSRRYAEAMELL